MKSKPFLKLVLVLAVFLGIQMGLFAPEPALAAPCCETCYVNHFSCTSSCYNQCGQDQGCLNVCFQMCDATLWQCESRCIRCGGGGGDPTCCYDFTGYCPAQCSFCVDC